MNRFYKSSAPRYTSQFVEDQYPVDLMLGYVQMKQQQQAAFADTVGKLQAEAVSTPNGLRTQTMAPIVRQKWDTNISEWATKNMTNYDSPSAIAELSKIHRMYQLDPDIQLMKKDAEDSELYKQMKIKAGASDVDPNIDVVTGGLWQFDSGSPYSPYQPIIADPDVPGRIYDEFNQLKPTKVTVPYISEVDHNGQKITVTGHKSVDRTDMDQYNQALDNLAKRGVANTEKWAVYQNAKFKQMYGRNMNYNDWLEYAQPIAEKTIKNDYSDQRSYHMPTDGSGSESGGGGGSVNLNWPATVKPTSESKIDEKTIRKITRIRKSNPNYDITSNPDYYNLYNMVKNSVNPGTGKLMYPDFDNMSENEQASIMKNEVVKPYKQSSQSIGFDIPTNDIRNELARYFAGTLDSNNKVTADAGSGLFEGQPIYDYETMSLVQNNDLKEIVKKDNSIVFNGPLSIQDAYGNSSIAYAPAPGLVGFEVTNKNGSKKYLIKLPSQTEAQKPGWNFSSYMRSSTGRGDGFTMDFYNYKDITDNKVKMGVKYYDSSDPGMNNDDANIKHSSNYSIHVIPYMDHANDGKVKYDIFSYNPKAIYGEGDQSAIINHNDGLYLKTYDLDTYETQDKVLEQILKDVNSKDPNINPILMKSQK